MGGDSQLEVSGKKLEIKAQCPKGKSKTVERAKEGREVRREGRKEEGREGRRKERTSERANQPKNRRKEAELSQVPPTIRGLGHRHGWSPHPILFNTRVTCTVVRLPHATVS